DGGVFSGGDRIGDDVGGRIDGDGDVGGLGDAAGGGDRIGEHGRAVVVGIGREGEHIAGAERHGAVADRNGRPAYGDCLAVDGGDLRAVGETVGARGLVCPAHRVEGDGGVFSGGDRIGDDVGGRIDGDGDVGGLGDAAGGGDRIGEHCRAVVVGIGREGELIAGAERHGAVADRNGRPAYGDCLAVDGGDLRAVGETVGARGLVCPAHRVEGDGGVFSGGDRIGDDVGGRIDGDGDVGGLGDAAGGGDRIGEHGRAVVVGIGREGELIAGAERHGAVADRNGRPAYGDCLAVDGGDLRAVGET